MVVYVHAECKETMKYLLSGDHESELWVLLGQARMSMLKVRRKELRQLNITISKGFVLTGIKFIGDKATPAQISRWLFLEPHSISELLSSMEREGLIRKVRDLGRRDQLRVVLTEKGSEICHQLLKIESIRRMMSSLSTEERQLLRSCLLKLRESAIKELGPRYELPFPPQK